MSIQAVEEGNLIAVSEIPLRMSLAFRILPLREMKEKHTRTHKRGFNHLSKSHTDTAVN